MKLIGFQRLAAVIGLLGLGVLAVHAADEKAVPAVKSEAVDGDKGVVPGANRKPLTLPGLTINLEDRCVDVEASICLREGALELIACTKDSKEHESIVVVAAKPMHIHAALLLLGAHPGNPAMRKPIDEQGTRWIDLPPKGDPVEVFLVFKNQEGRMVEHPISDFIEPTREDYGDPPGTDNAGAKGDIKFPNTFLFAGSILQGKGTGPRQYLSDLSGNVISIATFGDELLCMPDFNAQDNGELMWEINSTNLPELGAKVILRLRPQLQPQPVPQKGGSAPLPPDGTRQPAGHD